MIKPITNEQIYPDPCRSPAPDQSEYIQGEGDKSHPGLRVSAGRDGARQQRNRRLATTSPVLSSRDLAGAKLTVAFGTQAAHRLCRSPRGRLHRDRDGVDRDPGADHPGRTVFRRRLARSGAGIALRNRSDPDPLPHGMLDRDADLRLIRTGRQDRTLCPCREREGIPQGAPR